MTKQTVILERMAGFNQFPMKKILCAFLTLFYFSAFSQSADEGAGNTFKLGAGYTREFPGLAGSTLGAEFLRDMTPHLQGGAGIKRVNVYGYPRSPQVKEFTKATTLDFSLYFLPLRGENHLIRLGGGYSFSFYNIRRSYPVIEHDAQGASATTWNVQDGKGRVSGFNLAAEYEYLIPASSFSLGLRASLFKAYSRVIYFGPFAAIRF